MLGKYKPLSIWKECPTTMGYNNRRKSKTEKLLKKKKKGQRASVILVCSNTCRVHWLIIKSYLQDCQAWSSVAFGFHLGPGINWEYPVIKDCLKQNTKIKSVRQTDVHNKILIL